MTAASTIAKQVSVQMTRPYQRATYRTGAAGATLYSTAAAVLIELQGSATMVVRLRRLMIWAQAGTKFYTELLLQRSTTASGTGTPTASPTGEPSDPRDVAATAVCNYYGGAATYGTGHLTIGAAGLYVGAPAATNYLGSVTLDFTKDIIKPITLNGDTDFFAVYNTVTGLGTATYGFDLEWDEDLS